MPRAFVKRSLADLVPKFMANRRKDIASLQAALAESDFAAIKAIGHRLKGAGGGYGFDAITGWGDDIEQAALRQDGHTIATLAAALETYVNTVEIEVV